jgi:hypothetical protein
MDIRTKIKQVLKEQKNSKKVMVGCDFFPQHTNDYRWCKFAENKLMRNTRKVKQAMDNYVKEYLSTYTTGIRAVKYNKEHEFFSERREMVVSALNKFVNSCPKLRKYIIDRMIKFTEQYVIWNEEQQYDLLNKLNTNYTAAAYMMTSELPEHYKSSVSFENALEYFFNHKNNNAVTPFEEFMGRIEMDNKKEIREKINQTIAQKTKEGSLIEEKFYEYISEQIGSENVVVYAGDYSFMDMIGIDMLVKNPEGIWVPVQVKKYVGGCDDTTIKYARKHMCENWCVSNESKYFNIRVYDGEKMVKSKKQCKTLELDQTTFLNVHGTPNQYNQNEFCYSSDEQEEFGED